LTIGHRPDLGRPFELALPCPVRNRSRWWPRVVGDRGRGARTM